MYTFLLVRAAEGSTQEIFLAHGMTLAALAAVVAASWDAYLAAWPAPWSEGTQGYMTRERDALLAMLAAHAACTPGRYLLEPIDPVWEACTLVITDRDQGFVEEENRHTAAARWAASHAARAPVWLRS